MSYRFEHDPQSGAFYVRVREGEYRETIPLADEPGFGAGVDVDGEGNVLGFEFLSFEEYAELLARSGGTLEVPDVVENRESPLSLEEPESPDTILDAAISSLPRASRRSSGCISKRDIRWPRYRRWSAPARTWYARG